MSYDVYFWHQPSASIEDLREEGLEESLANLAPHPSIGAFRRDLLDQLPVLKDVVDPAADAPAVMSYVVLTLPFARLEHLTHVLSLARRHGLSGWDPQTGEPFGPQTPSLTWPRQPDGAAGPDGDGRRKAPDRRAVLKDWDCTKKGLSLALACMNLTWDELSGRSLPERAVTAGLTWYLSDGPRPSVSRQTAQDLLAQTIALTQAEGWTGALTICDDGDHAAVLPGSEAIMWEPDGCRAATTLFQLSDLKQRAQALHPR